MNEKRKSPSTEILLLCWLAYTSAYLGRYSYNSNITAIMDSFGVSHSDAGLVTTCFFFAYGIGQVINGMLCKRYNKKQMVILALLTSALVNLAVFLGAPFFLLKYLWILNGALQSVLWPTLICILSQALPKAELKRSVIVMSTTVPIGTAVAYGLSALLAVWGNYQFSFLSGAVIMTAAAVIWLVRFRNVSRETEPEAQAPRPERSPAAAPSSSLVFLVVLLGLFAVANNLVKDGLTTWVPAILKERFSLPDSLSILLTLTLPILGLFGAACNTLLEKRIHSFVSLSGFWYLLTAFCLGAVIFFLNFNLWIPALSAFGLVSLFMHGVNNIITSMAPLYMRKQADSGLLAGVLNGCCYVGSTISSYGLGAVADHFGWNGVFFLLLAISLVPVMIAPLASRRIETT